MYAPLPPLLSNCLSAEKTKDKRWGGGEWRCQTFLRLLHIFGIPRIFYRGQGRRSVWRDVWGETKVKCALIYVEIYGIYIRELHQYWVGKAKYLNRRKINLIWITRCMLIYLNTKHSIIYALCIPKPHRHWVSIVYLKKESEICGYIPLCPQCKVWIHCYKLFLFAFYPHLTQLYLI